MSDKLIHEKVAGVIIDELRDLGVKLKKEKMTMPAVDKMKRTLIFRTNIDLLEQTDVFLANGTVVQIPKFIAESCNLILTEVGTEGIFRKAGSVLRQRQIRTNLEAGLPYPKNVHVIDVANVLKFFFRELPVPLLPPSVQDIFVKSLLANSNRVKAILLTSLLLSTNAKNVLSFLMQFLLTVSLNSAQNKMTSENLAVLFAPSLMPCTEKNAFRLKNNIQVIKILIENANSIGTVPKNIADKINSRINVPDSKSVNAAPPQKKKRRRSEIFNGIKKVVGTAFGNSENSDFFFEKRRTSLHPCLAPKEREHILNQKTKSYLMSCETPIKTQQKNLELKDLKRRWSTMEVSRKEQTHYPDEKRLFKAAGDREDYQTNSYEQTQLNCAQIKLNNCPTPSRQNRRISTLYVHKRKPENTMFCPFDKEGKANFEVADKSFYLKSSNTEKCVPLTRDQKIKLSPQDYKENLFTNAFIKDISMGTNPDYNELIPNLNTKFEIHRRLNCKPLRSPSARKIGRIRRRGQEERAAVPFSTKYVSYNAAKHERI